jgi:hypothetical protein
MWIFDPSILTFLRTYEDGAMKATFAVALTDVGFACTASVSRPRESGVPTIVLQSPKDGGWVEIVSAKQSTSLCTISKPSSDGQTTDIATRHRYS